jgi:serine/threonine protein kinase
MSDPERTVFLPPTGLAPSPSRLNGIYEVERLIGTGGMGEVYQGRAIQTGDAVAIKIDPPRHWRSDARRRSPCSGNEAAALHNLYNEAIVRYYVFTIDPGTQSPYLAMEFVDGQPLSDRIKQAPLSLDEVDVLRRRIGPGLHAAHLLGIVHRDVSPDNIILPGGSIARAKIIDFGIARSSKPGRRHGHRLGFRRQVQLCLARAARALWRRRHRPLRHVQLRPRPRRSDDRQAARHGRQSGPDPREAPSPARPLGHRRPHPPAPGPHARRRPGRALRRHVGGRRLAAAGAGRRGGGRQVAAARRRRHRRARPAGGRRLLWLDPAERRAAARQRPASGSQRDP